LAQVALIQTTRGCPTLYSCGAVALFTMAPNFKSQSGSDDESQRAQKCDYLFRCSYCIKLIAEDSAVYMRQDHSYCSIECRDKGLSRLFTQLKETQLQEAMKASTGSLASLVRAASDSSIASRGTGSDCAEVQKSGLLMRFGQAVLDVVLHRVASRSWGAQVLRTASSGMLWGKEFTKEYSSAAMLFDYLPELDRYLSDGKLNALMSGAKLNKSFCCLSTSDSLCGLVECN